MCSRRYRPLYGRSPSFERYPSLDRRLSFGKSAVLGTNVDWLTFGSGFLDGDWTAGFLFPLSSVDLIMH